MFNLGRHVKEFKRRRQARKEEEEFYDEIHRILKLRSLLDKIETRHSITTIHMSELHRTYNQIQDHNLYIQEYNKLQRLIYLKAMEIRNGMNAARDIEIIVCKKDNRHTLRINDREIKIDYLLTIPISVEASIE